MVGLAVIGVAMAIRLRHFDIPPPRRYSWEDEVEAAEGEGTNADPPQWPPGEDGRGGGGASGVVS